MSRGLGRLPFFPRRRRDTTAHVAPPPVRPIDPDAAPVGPPLLLPAAIVRQILFEAIELTPAWALPRATPTPAIVDPIPGPPAQSLAGDAKPAKPGRRAASGTASKAARPRPSTSRAADARPGTPRPRRKKPAG